MTNALQAQQLRTICNLEAAKNVAKDYSCPPENLLQGVGAYRLLTSNLQRGVLSVASLCSCSILLDLSFLCVNSFPEKEMLGSLCICGAYPGRNKNMHNTATPELLHLEVHS